MKQLLLFFIASLLFTQCSLKSVHGSDEIVTKTFDLKDFESLDLSSNFNVTIRQGDEYLVELSYNSNIEEHLEVDVENHTLIVGLQSRISYRDVELHLLVQLPNLKEVDASGACEIDFEGFKTENLAMDLSGASEVNGKLLVKNTLSIESSGASEIQLKGKTRNLELDLSGASEFKGKKLKITDNTVIEASGASSITINSNGPIEIDASGASSINYYGTGEIVSQEVSGASSINKK